jgi:hypothetical protein
MFGSGRYEGTRTLWKSGTNVLSGVSWGLFWRGEFPIIACVVNGSRADEEHLGKGCDWGTRCVAYDVRRESSGNPGTRWYIKRFESCLGG